MHAIKRQDQNFSIFSGFSKKVFRPFGWFPMLAAAVVAQPA
jgi:predicted acetyltransferase